MNNEKKLIQDLQREVGTLTKAAGRSAEVRQLSRLFSEVSVLKNQQLAVNENVEQIYNSILLHRPKDVADFMKLFDDANGLKYLTHEFDDPNKTFDIHTFLKQSERLFTKSVGLYGLFKIPPSLYAVVKNFAFESRPKWTAEEEITEGWSSPEWITWSELNGHPLKSRKFEPIVQSFRQATRIKNSLRNVIDTAVNLKFGDKKADFHFDYHELVDRADFYTYVVTFKRALVALFDEICGRPQFPNVKFMYDRGSVGDYRTRIVTIVQEGSYPTNKTLDETLGKLRQGGGQLYSIRNHLFGYCDWHIETIWDEKPVRVHFLKEGMKYNKIEAQVDELTTLTYPGFAHTLTFYFR